MLTPFSPVAKPSMKVSKPLINLFLLVFRVAHAHRDCVAEAVFETGVMFLLQLQNVARMRHVEEIEDLGLGGWYTL